VTTDLPLGTIRLFQRFQVADTTFPRVAGGTIDIVASSSVISRSGSFFGTIDSDGTATVKYAYAPNAIALRKVGRTVIEATNNYSENTTLEARVVFPTDHPRAGRTVTTYNGQITLEEISSPRYYDGVDGASALPTTIQISRGNGQLIVKSVSNSAVPNSPPIDAQLRASGPQAQPDPATNPLHVQQWVDEDGKGKDWLVKQATDLLKGFRSNDGIVKDVARHVARITEAPDIGDGGIQQCGVTAVTVVPLTNCGATIQVARTIGVAPTCLGLHRLNTNNELSDTILHEGRHAWHTKLQRLNLGSNDDGNNATPRNDDDMDGLPEDVPVGSEAEGIIDGVVANSTGDASCDDDGSIISPALEAEATAFGNRHRFD
jgi:hypothetical protein